MWHGIPSCSFESRSLRLASFMESKRIRSIVLINGTHEAFNGKQRGEPITFYLIEGAS